MLFYRKELLLVQVLIRYGEKIICYAENEQGEEVPVSVAEFIDYALQEDGLLFHHALHKRILQEAIDHIHEKDFSSERYFLNHPDNHISMLAFELSGDKYQLSKYHSKHQKIASDEERLTELVPPPDFRLQTGHCRRRTETNPPEIAPTRYSFTQGRIYGNHEAL